MSDYSISQLIQESLFNEAVGFTTQASREYGIPNEEKQPSRYDRIKNWLNDKKGTVGSYAKAGSTWVKNKGNEALNYTKQNPVKVGLGTAGTLATAGAIGYGINKYRNRNSLSNRINKFKNQAQSTMKKHGGKIAGGAAAALGAAVGTKALLRYLRKKKK